MMVSARRGRCPKRRKQATRRPDESSATGSFKQKASARAVKNHAKRREGGLAPAYAKCVPKPF